MSSDADSTRRHDLDAGIAPETTTDAAAAVPPALRVLLVEDQADLRDLLADVMQDRGMEVRTVGNAHAAMELLDAGYACDVLFSDVHMPGEISGAQLGEHVARTLPAARVILASGHPPFKLPPLPAGAHFLQKPFRLNQFFELVDVARDSARAEAV